MYNAYDMVVIGAGIQGVSTAYYASKNGMKVALMDAGDIADKTSSHSNGNIVYSDKQPGYDAQLTMLSKKLISEELPAQLEYDYQWRSYGHWLLIENDTELALATNLCRDFREKNNADVFLLDRETMLDEEPNIADDVIGALVFPTDGALYSIGLSYGLAHGARKRGCDMYLHSRVTSIRQDAEASFHVCNDNGQELIAGTVVDCAGSWAAEIGAMLQVPIPVVPRQGMIILSERGYMPVRKVMMEFGYMAIKFAGDSYKRNVSEEMDAYGVAMSYQPTEANNFLLGASRRFVGFDMNTQADVIRCIAERAIRFFPTIRNINVIRSYTGLRPSTPDHYPIVSETRVPGFYVCAGHEGDGIGLGPISGKLIAQMAIRQPTEVDMTPLSLSRFDG